MKYYLAEYEGRKFSFQAIGRTRQEAIVAVQQGWEDHCSQLPYIPDMPLLSDIDVQVTEMEAGKCYRDRELITVKTQG